MPLQHLLCPSAIPRIADGNPHPKPIERLLRMLHLLQALAQGEDMLPPQQGNWFLKCLRVGHAGLGDQRRIVGRKTVGRVHTGHRIVVQEDALPVVATLLNQNLVCIHVISCFCYYPELSSLTGNFKKQHFPRCKVPLLTTNSCTFHFEKYTHTNYWIAQNQYKASYCEAIFLQVYCSFAIFFIDVPSI